MQVKLVAVLDVEHEIASVQVLHHKEEVLLDAEMKRGQDSVDVYWWLIKQISCLGLEGAVKVREEGIFPS